MSTAQEIANQVASRTNSVGHDIAGKVQSVREKAGIKLDQAVIAAGLGLLSLYAIAIVFQVVSGF